MVFFNESIIPRLLIDYTKKIDSGAKVQVLRYNHDESGRVSDELKEWPLNEKLKKGLQNDKSIDLHFDWGLDYWITFKYQPDGNIVVNSSNPGTKCYSLREWRNNPDFQNKMLANAYKHPNVYDTAPPIY